MPPSPNAGLDQGRPGWLEHEYATELIPAVTTSLRADTGPLRSVHDTLPVRSISDTAPMPVVKVRRRRQVIALIPVHNELEVTHTIEAILNQTRPPDQVYVLTDCKREKIAQLVPIWGIASQYPVSIVYAVDNEHRKAGNLNAALHHLLPWLDAGDIVMGFDADSIPCPDFIANALKWLNRGYGAVGATFHGRSGGGMLGLLQRGEFARFARHQHRKSRCDVLSGTGWAVPVGILRGIAATRPDGMVYDAAHITEDFELTLAIRRYGVATVAPSDCAVTTDVMITLRDWVTQRLRWQLGTLAALSAYGWTRETREMIIRQVMIYLVMIATPLTVIYLAWSVRLFGWEGINPLHAPVYAAGIAIVICEQAWQARKAGPKAVLATLIIIPDLTYSIARQVIYMRALYRLIRRKKTNWGAGTRL